MRCAGSAPSVDVSFRLGSTDAPCCLLTRVVTSRTPCPTTTAGANARTTRSAPPTRRSSGPASGGRGGLISGLASDAISNTVVSVGRARCARQTRMACSQRFLGRAGGVCLPAWANQHPASNAMPELLPGLMPACGRLPGQQHAPVHALAPSLQRCCGCSCCGARLERRAQDALHDPPRPLPHGVTRCTRLVAIRAPSGRAWAGHRRVAASKLV